MAEKKGLPLISRILDFFSQAVELIIDHADAEIKKIKKLVLRYVVVYGLFTLALVFILIGLTKYLAIAVFFREDLAFIVVGSVMIVMLAAYSMIRRL